MYRTPLTRFGDTEFEDIETAMGLKMQAFRD